MRHNHKQSFLCRSFYSLLLTFVAFSWPSVAVEVSGADLRVHVAPQKPEAAMVSFWAPQYSSATLTGVKAAERELSTPTSVMFKDGTERLALLVAIDTSNPARAEAVKAQLATIHAMLEKTTQQLPTDIAVATLDKELTTALAFGTAKDTWKDVFAEIKAQGLTTELWRNTLNALELLQKHEAARRALILVSDGKAEDEAYSMQDVITRAKEAGIPVYALGYPASISESVELQDMRRLSEETGGFYLEANEEGVLPEAWESKLIASLGNGGTATLDLSQPIKEGLYGTTELAFTFTVDEQTKTLTAPFDVTAITTADPLQRQYGHLAPTQLRDALNMKTLWGVLTVLTLTVLAIAAIILRRKKTEAEAPTAFLRLLDSNESVFPVTSSAVRIGRDDENDVVLRNTSVSGFHAELHETRDGSFRITDLKSLNGLTVNGKKESSATLQSNDVIELGEVRIAFMKAA